MSRAPSNLASLFPEGIVAATGNKNKALELASVASSYGVRVFSGKEYASERGLAPIGEVIEDGSSYAENALIKARAYCAWSGLPALGDDSGLEVAALDNRPGLYSARYLGEHASDTERCSGILRELAELEHSSSMPISRAAAFVCYLALVYPDGRVVTAEGRLEGEVLRASRGTNGFGYDPIIHLFKLNKTLAEVDFATTCAKGFRAEAATALFEKLVSG